MVGNKMESQPVKRNKPATVNELLSTTNATAETGAVIACRENEMPNVLHNPQMPLDAGSMRGLRVDNDETKTVFDYLDLKPARS